MKLYYSAGACSLAPHIALYEACLKFTTIPVNLRTKVMKVGNTESDFLKVNPKGYVPTIELNNGEILSECAAILQYIADQAIEKNLIPRNGTFERLNVTAVSSGSPSSQQKFTKASVHFGNPLHQTNTNK